MRERILISGEAGSGKTNALFSIIEGVLLEGKENIFYMDHDLGAERFLYRVGKNHFDADNPEGRFHYYQCPDWITTRNAYRDVRRQWNRGDWFMEDRVDLVWDWVQHYFNALVNELSEDELDQVYLARRVATRKQLADTDKPKKDVSPEGDIGGVDWAPIKNAYNTVGYDAFCGVESASRQINVVMTALAKSKSEVYRPQGMTRADPRDLSGFGVVVQGEKNLPSLTDTHLLLEKSPIKGYVMHTVKNRERNMWRDVELDERGFYLIYQQKTGEK